MLTAIKNKLIHFHQKVKYRLSLTIHSSSRFIASARVGDQACTNCSLTVGERSLIRGFLYFTKESAVISIGSNTSMGTNTVVNCSHYIRIGSNCLISFDCLFMDNDGHSLNHKKRQLDLYNVLAGLPKIWNDVHAKAIVIEDNVWIGSRAIILKGVTIGEKSIIAAGSVVTRSIPANCVVAGNPAKVVRTFE